MFFINVYDLSLFIFKQFYNSLFLIYVTTPVPFLFHPLAPTIFPHPTPYPFFREGEASYEESTKTPISLEAEPSLFSIYQV